MPKDHTIRVDWIGKQRLCPKCAQTENLIQDIIRILDKALANHPELKVRISEELVALEERDDSLL